jgi:hypothetical protein
MPVVQTKTKANVMKKCDNEETAATDFLPLQKIRTFRRGQARASMSHPFL